jgi:hypothetical protein
MTYVQTHIQTHSQACSRPNRLAPVDYDPEMIDSHEILGAVVLADTMRG